MYIPKIITNFAAKIVLVWPPLRKRFIPTFRFFVRKVGLFNKFGNMTQDDFVRRCTEKYGNDFDYSLVEYENLKSRIKVICNTCGCVFHVRANHFLYEKRKGCCPYCMGKKLQETFAFTNEQFIEKAKKIYGNKYDYSLVQYTNMHTPVNIICKEHGVFCIKPMEHLDGRKCPICQRQERPSSRNKSNRFDFIKKAMQTHGNKYDYSKVVYVNCKTPVEIVCHKHGSFFQVPYVHYKCGCPYCNKSKGEEKIERFLNDNNVLFETQYKINNNNIFCKNKYMYVDFYIKEQNIIIEYNGQQHYRITGYFGGAKKLQDTQERDMALRQYCKEHKIKLVEIPYWDYDKIETILKKELKIK